MCHVFLGGFKANLEEVYKKNDRKRDMSRVH